MAMLRSVNTMSCHPPFLRDDYFAKLTAQAKVHGQEAACAQLRQLAERLEGMLLKDALQPVQDDASSAGSQPPYSSEAGTPHMPTGDAATTGDLDVPMHGGEEMIVDEVIEDDAPMPCAIDISSEVQQPNLDELRRVLAESIQETFTAQAAMDEVRNTSFNRALGATVATAPPVLTPSDTVVTDPQWPAL